MVAVLASVWWGMFVLGARMLALEDGPSASWRRLVYVAGCPVDGVGLAEDSPRKGPKEGCSEEGPSHLSLSCARVLVGRGCLGPLRALVASRAAEAPPFLMRQTCAPACSGLGRF